MDGTSHNQISRKPEPAGSGQKNGPVETDPFYSRYCAKGYFTILAVLTFRAPVSQSLAKGTL